VSGDFRGAYGKPTCAWCHKRHRNGTACPVRTREEAPNEAGRGLTPSKRRALEVLAAFRGGLTAARFAALMWPDAPAWNKSGRCGPYGSSRGLGIRQAGGGFLGKLRKAGLSASYYKEGHLRLHVITADGLEALRQTPPPNGGRR
jgi:hypothetical protein